MLRKTSAKVIFIVVIEKCTTTKATLPICFLLFLLGNLQAQHTFPEQVARTFGSDQELVNGIQFANHFGLIDGHPYFLDEGFREGSVYVNAKWYEDVIFRYNLYTQRLEIEYLTAEGNLNLYMAVAGMMTSFRMDKREFRLMEFPDEEAAYYLVISSGTSAAYIGWKKDLVLAKTSESKDYEFTMPEISYWLKLDQELVTFHNRKTFRESFPEYMQKELLRMVKQRRYIFSYPTVAEAEALMKDALLLYERGHAP